MSYIPVRLDRLLYLVHFLDLTLKHLRLQDLLPIHMRCFRMSSNNSENTTYSEYFKNGIPELLTEEELVIFLRIPQVSKSKDYHNVILNLIRFRNLPRIQIGKKLLFPKKTILEWIDKETKN